MIKYLLVGRFDIVKTATKLNLTLTRLGLAILAYLSMFNDKGSGESWLRIYVSYVTHALSGLNEEWAAFLQNEEWRHEIC